MEEWRKTHIDPDFEVSSLGNLRKSNGKYKSQWRTNWGYMQAEFKNKKKHAVHRLIGFAFLNDTYFEGAVINHKDSDKTNNKVENLEWVTQSQNIKHSFQIGTHSIVGEKHPSAILTEKKVIEIRHKRKIGFKVKHIATEYGVSLSTIYDICRNKNWSHI